MGIPGEDLPGSHSATEFVGWYNGHPDFRHLGFELLGRAGGRGRHRQRGDGRGPHPGQPARGAGHHRHRRPRPRAAGREPHPRDLRARPARAGPGRLHHRSSRRSASCPASRWSSTRPSSSWAPSSRPAWPPRPTAPAKQPRDPARATPPARRPARRGGSSCASWSRRWRSSAASASRRWWWSTTSSTRARTAACARSRPTGARPCRWGWSSAPSATRGCRCRGCPSTRWPA